MEQDHGRLPDGTGLGSSEEPEPFGLGASRAIPDAKHTALPWRVGADLIRIHTNWRDEGGNCTPENFHRNGYAKTIASVGREDGDWRGIEQQVADAAFIVHACNSHYELLEALARAECIAAGHDPDSHVGRVDRFTGASEPLWRAYLANRSNAHDR